MTFFEFFLVLVELMVFGMVVVAANYADQARSSRMAAAVTGVLLLLNAVFVAAGLMSLLAGYGSSSDEIEALDTASAWGGMIIAMGVAGLSTALLFRSFRERITVLFPRFQAQMQSATAGEIMSTVNVIPLPQVQPSGEPLFPQMLNYYTTTSTPPVFSGSVADAPEPAAEPSLEFRAAYRVRGFDPSSRVHMLAIVLVLYLLGSQFFSFIIGGGLEGLAESYEEAGLDVWSLLANSLPMVLLPLLGVGWGMRRTLRQSLDRLGLGPVTLKGLGISLGVTFMLYAGMFFIGMIWMFVVPKDVYEEQNQATDALSESVDTIWLAFMLAATAAVGEEITFRGALQPVIGFWPTAIVFALTHTQYTLTPAWLIILAVAIAFGWVRKRYNTTVSIMTHFWYNLFQLLLLFLPTESTEAFLRILPHL